MIIDLSCPIELRGYELLTDDLGSTRAYIRLMNLSVKPVTAYSATVLWFNGITGARISENIDVDACEIAPKTAFKLIQSTRNVVNIDHVEMYFSKVVFSDGDMWTPKDGALVEIGEQKVLEGVELDNLRHAAGADAVQYPQVQREYWRCVCGRVNLQTEEYCVRCGREQRDVLKRFNAKAFSGVRTSAKKTPARGKKRAHGRKSKFLSVIIAIIMIAIVVLLAVIGYRIGTNGGLTFPKETPAPTYMNDQEVMV